MKNYTTQAGVELTQKQCECIAELEKLARKWKRDSEGLWLFSASGTHMIECDEVNEITFTTRFPKPKWYN